MLFVSLVVVGICEVFVAVGYNAARQGEAAGYCAGCHQIRDTAFYCLGLGKLTVIQKVERWLKN